MRIGDHRPFPIPSSAAAAAIIGPASILPKLKADTKPALFSIVYGLGQSEIASQGREKHNGHKNMMRRKIIMAHLCAA
jgi:hypothetical protein